MYPKEQIEIIVVDDGSTDNLKEKIMPYAVKYIYQANAGPAAARNNGFAHTNGEFIFFTDADCIPSPHWVDGLLAHYTSEEIGVVGGSYEIANPKNLLADCIHEEILMRHSVMPLQPKALGSYNLSTRRNIFERLNGFDQDYTMASGEDNDLSYRILKNGFSLVFDKAIRVAHYHPTNLFKYLKTQFWHGFWRVKLYVTHPRMSKGDNYSSPLDYLNPFIAFSIIGLAPCIAFSWARGAIFILSGLLFLLQTPLAVILSYHKKKNYATLRLLGSTFLRSFARGMGLCYGVFQLIIMKKKTIVKTQTRLPFYKGGKKMRKLLIGTVLFLIMLFAFLTASYAQQPPYSFLNGKDWATISRYDASAAVIKNIKTDLLKTVYEVTLFSDNPLFTINAPKENFLQLYNADMQEYCALVDTFYSRQENLWVPVFFALKITNMIKNGASDQQIEVFKAVVAGKLKQQGLL